MSKKEQKQQTLDNVLTLNHDPDLLPLLTKPYSILFNAQTAAQNDIEQGLTLLLRGLHTLKNGQAAAEEMIIDDGSNNIIYQDFRKPVVMKA